MIKVGSNIFVGLVEKKPKGFEFHKGREEWPLHMTLLAWFFADDDQFGPLNQKIQRIATNTKPIDCRVGNPELFGPNNDIPVNVISDVIALRGLHVALLDAVDQSGAVLQVPRTYLGPSFRPHITRHSFGGAEQGSVLRLEDFARIKLGEDNICQVEEIYRLGQQVETAA